jgi:hypothetical protein
MVLVMVQGHMFDTLLTPEARAHALYQIQAVFHGSTAPGFLFASGFVAGLPRAPLSLPASIRRARRMLFVLGVGYAIHLPYFSFWKTVHESTPAERAALFACDALQVIAVTQLFVLALQWAAGRRWIGPAAGAMAALLAAGPWVWAERLSARVPPALGAYLDVTTGSQFPVFPFSAFVLAGTVAGAAIGRRDEATRHRRALLWGVGLIGGGLLLAVPLRGRVAFWGVSPAYALLRIGGLLLLMRIVEALARRGVPGVRPLARLGHETLLAFVLHLYLLYGGVISGAGPLARRAGALGYAEAFAALAAMVLVLYAACRAWHRFKAAAPHEATLMLVFLSTWFAFEFLTRPW